MHIYVLIRLTGAAHRKEGRLIYSLAIASQNNNHICSFASLDYSFGMKFKVRRNCISIDFEGLQQYPCMVAVSLEYYVHYMSGTYMLSQAFGDR